MRFLLTLNMPSMTGNMVQQIIVGHKYAKTCLELTEILNENQFVNFTLWYRYQEPNEPHKWDDRGDIVINTDHIGKVQLFVEKSNDEAHGTIAKGPRYSGGKSSPLRSV